MPCNIHSPTSKDLGAALVRALEERGAKAFIFGTPVVADGEVQGIAGMRFSLPSRDLVVRPLSLLARCSLATRSLLTY